jgi:uncharacterized coiled-coil DUF342 family protein
MVMEDLPHASSAEIAKRLRELAKGLTDPEDIAAVHKYVDELEKESRKQSTQPSTIKKPR